MSYKEFIISNLGHLYAKYEATDNAVTKRLLMKKIKCYLSDLIEYVYMKNIMILIIALIMMCSCGNRNKTENVDNQIDTTEVVDSVENTL